MKNINSTKLKEMVKVESGTYIMGLNNLDEKPFSAANFIMTIISR